MTRIISVKLVDDIAPVAQQKLEAYNNGLRFIVGTDIANPKAVIFRSSVFDADQELTVDLAVRAGAEPKVRGKRLETGGVCVETTPGANSESVVYKIFYAFTGLAARLYEAEFYGRHPTSKNNEKDKGGLVGNEDPSLTLGIIGAGQIGFRVAIEAEKRGIPTIVYESQRLSPLYRALPSRVVKARSIEELLAKADIVTLHVPGHGNKNLINEKRLSQMRKGAGIINCARPDVVDNLALYKAIEAGHIGGAHIDWIDERLPQDHPKLKQLPHVSANTREAQIRSAEQAADQIIEFYRYGNVLGGYNWPENLLDPSGVEPVRIAILHINQEGMLKRFETEIDRVGMSIGPTQNAIGHDRRLGYYIADLQKPADHELVSAIRGAIEAIPGVLDMKVFDLTV